MASQDNNNNEEEHDDMKDVVDPREADVLCGRGGAALRHIGNQTYRRLVNLNKGLYITCLNTEKLKISRSIIAAIREQNGRFLERDSKKGVWFDIGDKKAIEKTSQALREGQPKLRKKMVEMGQIPAEQVSGGGGGGITDPVPVSVQQQQQQQHQVHQYGNGIYIPRTQSWMNDGSMNNCMNLNLNMNLNNNIGRVGKGNFSTMQEQQQNQILMGRNYTGQLRNGFTQMPPPPLRGLSNDMNNNNNNDNDNSDELSILKYLSLTSNPQSIPSWTPSIGSAGSFMGMSTTGDDHQPQLISSRNRNPSYGPFTLGNSNNNNNDLQSLPQQSTISTTSDMSGFVINGNGNNNGPTNLVDPNVILEKIGSFNPSDQQQQQQVSTNTRDHGRNGFNENNSNNNNNNNVDDQRSRAPINHDRRRHFARMKNARTAPTRSMSSESAALSITDGMPDIHMVDSQFSLLSNLSAHGSKHHGQNAMDMAISTHGSVFGRKDSLGNGYIGIGSRRSLMSDFKSGHSDIHNTFSNMSKKIGGGTNHNNISSRSLAMSEFSGIDEEFAEDDFSFDVPTTTTTRNR